MAYAKTLVRVMMKVMVAAERAALAATSVAAQVVLQDLSEVWLWSQQLVEALFADLAAVEADGQEEQRESLISDVPPVAVELPDLNSSWEAQVEWGRPTGQNLAAPRVLAFQDQAVLARIVVVAAAVADAVMVDLSG